MRIAPRFTELENPRAYLRTAVVNGCRAAAGQPALTLAELLAAGAIEYVDFPQALVGKYQCFTEADLGRLRGTGCDHSFSDVDAGVGSYVEWLLARSP